MTIVELAKLLDLSHESLSGYRTGRLKISHKAWNKLISAEAKAGILSGQILMKPVQDFSDQKNPALARNNPARTEMHSSSSVKLNPAFAPPVGNPTQQDCIDHLAAYLAEAKHVPGLVAHTLIELKKHFKIADARAQREDL